MPRVVMVCNYVLDPGRIGGMDRLFWALDEAMARSGWTATWLFPDSPDCGHYEERDMQVRTVVPGSLPSEAGALTSRDGGADLLVSHFMDYPTRYAHAWKRRGVRRYLAVDHMSRPSAQRSRRVLRRKRLKGTMLRGSVDGVVAVSGFVRDAAVAELGPSWIRKIQVVPNGVDPSVFYPGSASLSAERPLHVVAVAHLIPEKGIQVLLEALASVRASLPRFEVSIAGEGPYEPQLRRLAAGYGLDGNVRFLGSISSQDELLRGADIAVIPSLWQEAFGLTLLEAMACGVAPIASRVGAMPEVAGDGAALLVEPGSPDDLGRALVTLADDDDLRRRMGERAAARAAQNYRLEDAVAGYLAVMERTMDGADGAEPDRTCT